LPNYDRSMLYPAQSGFGHLHPPTRRTRPHSRGGRDVVPTCGFTDYFIKQDSPFCLTMIGLCYTPLSLVSAICTLRHGDPGRTVAGAAMLCLRAGVGLRLNHLLGPVTRVEKKKKG